MESDEIESYEKAGKILSKIRNNAVKLIKNDLPILDLVNYVESETLKAGAGISFPCNVSINEITAHYTSPINDTNKMVTGDLVKLDMGTEINGYVADSAVTIMVPGDNLEDLFDEETLNKNQNIIEASAAGLEAAISTVREGVEIGKIGQAIEDAIHEYKLNPVSNLTGHSLEKWNLHAGLSIPNINNHDTTKLKEGQAIAIEPFATDGIGLVNDTPNSYIYSFLKNKPYRIKHDQKVIDYIENNYHDLPFSGRWITEKFNPNRAHASLRKLSQTMSIYPYAALKEKSGAWVAQKEHTVIVEPDGCNVTTL